MNPVKWLVRILFLLFLSLLSIAADTITLDHFIRDNGTEIVVSSGKVFALGFFSPGRSRNRYVGIWYFQVPEQTVVWVANRDNPIKDNSGNLRIDGRGNLALFHGNQTVPVWSSNTSITGTSNTIAQILDSGNLVLLQNDTRRSVLWQSFDYPTNTLLPFMKLGLSFRTGLNRVITSWKSPDDPGVGNCSYRINPSGFPQLYLYKGSAPLWRTGSWTGRRWSGVPEMTSNYIFNISFVNTVDEVSITYGVRNSSFITRMVTNETGIQQRFTWNREAQHWIGFCAYAETDGGIGCLTWHGDLVDTRTYTDAGQDLYIRVDANDLARDTKKDPFHNKGVLAITIVSAVVLFLILLALLHCLVTRLRRAERRKKRNAFSFTSSSLFEDSLGEKEIDESRRNGDLPFFDLSTIAAATNNFSTDNKLGQGGFGTVYKGVLFNGKEIAVKRLSKHSGQGVQEFKNEIVLIAKLQHRNLDSRLRIIHRDLKASNVLLDAEMNPKISDFGMARIFGGDQIEGDTKRVVGTYGYMSPEYAMHGHFSTKSDVYSFGVLLLEIITGKKNSTYFPDNPSSNLVGHVWDLWEEDKAIETVDSALAKTQKGDEISTSEGTGSVNDVTITMVQAR
ncbi:hypothetical protein V6N12_024992 [Hibiscus sabdariffa]|uniref:Receptor-like serine/threonine-protein kinase n=1 Tax=Hibiscus sabdariffa TaxID=183260 RepID=A0ABR2AVX4_9ROSI